MLDYLHAPMPFLIGIHESFVERARALPLMDIVWVSLDEDKVEVPTEFNGKATSSYVESPLAC